MRVTYSGFGSIFERTPETTPCFTIKTRVTDAAIREFRLAANVAHIAGIDRPIALFCFLRYVTYRMSLRLRFAITEIASTAQNIRIVCFIAEISVYIVVRAAPFNDEKKVGATMN